MAGTIVSACTFTGRAHCQETNGCIRALSVPRTWLYTRIRRGTLPATQHPHTGHYLIPDDPQLLAALHQQASAYRRLGAAVGSSSAPSPTSLSEAEAV